MRVRPSREKYEAARQDSRLRDLPNLELADVNCLQEYLVYGMWMQPISSAGPMVFVLIDLAEGKLVWTPIVMVDVVDPRPSAHWEVRIGSDMSIDMRPPEFFEDYFLDDATSYEPAALARVRHWKTILQTEHDTM